jgi:hypothetical protein
MKIVAFLTLVLSAGPASITEAAGPIDSPYATAVFYVH